MIRPTTTLAAETSNNTSAANSFGTQSNGNQGATNISKLDIHSLLYPAAQTKVFAHLMLWFGQSDHMNIGYSSTDPAQVKRQVSDMISRGIDGVVMVWYGPNNAIDRAAKLVMNEAEKHPGFTFVIMVDNGAIRWNSCSGCNVQQALVRNLQYVEQTYFPSPAYLRVNGRPVVTNFDIDLYYKVDWSAARAELATDPLFLFQHGAGFSHELSDGAYSWDIPTTTDYGMSYLTKFYSTGLKFPGKQTWGAAYKGFNDKSASWGLNRFMGQQCGQTWLQTFSKINSLYDSTNQLPALQLVTWNDYEEGTEIESGIDNCVDISAAVAGSSLQWKVTGNENTIDHYTVYVSADGQNLMPLADLATGSRALDMCGYSLSSAKYTLFVQAVGKPTLSNQMSGPVSYAAQCGSTTAAAPPPTSPTPTPAAPNPPVPPPAAPAIAVTASPSSVTIAGGQSGSSTIRVTAQSAGSDGPVSFSCSNLPAGMSCIFSPAVFVSRSRATTAVLRISVTRPVRTPKPPLKNRHTSALYPYSLIFGVAGFLVLGQIDRKRILRALALSGLIASVLLFSSCGGMPTSLMGNESPGGVAPGAYTIMVNATSGTTQASTAARITIR